MEQITVHLTGDDAVLLEELANSENVNMREMVALALSHYLISPPGRSEKLLYTLVDLAAFGTGMFFLGMMI